MRLPSARQHGSVPSAARPEEDGAGIVSLQNSVAKQQLDKFAEWCNSSCSIVGGELAYGRKKVGKVGQAAA